MNSTAHATAISARVLALACFVMAGSALASAGKVLFVSGDAHIERATKIRPLAKGTAVETGDLIVTGSDGRAQLLMEDGDRIALRPNSHFRIDEFRAPESPAKPATGRSFYSLLKGGLQTLTRSLGLRGEDSYRVRTPIATIGIRGTHYVMHLCQVVCPPDWPPGIYLRVLDGTVTMHNTGGSLDVHKNQIAFAPDINTAPVLLKDSVFPPFLFDDSVGKGDDSLGSKLSTRRGPGVTGGNSQIQEGITPEQPIRGTDSQGNPINLTPGQAPPAVPPPPSEYIP